MTSFVSFLVTSVIGFAFVYLFFGFDDLWIDWIAYRKQLKPRKLTEEEKHRWTLLKQKRIAILIPAWKESNVISKMLRGNMRSIQYDRYHFFVGCYPNDLPTFRAVLKVAEETGRVTPILNELPGPTSKGQLLNWVLRELTETHFPQFDIFLFHDAEDIIHPLSLKLINSEADNAEFIQIPVFSLPINKELSVGATYMDEFAEVHTRDLLVRKHLNVALPSAGVGFALTRKAMFSLRPSSGQSLFESSCLTEDYLLGLNSYRAGLTQSFPCLFESNDIGQRSWIATYEYFPSSLLKSVRQKARWTEGIAIQAAKQFGWFGSFRNRLFLYRDRKAVTANSLGLLGLAFLPMATLGILTLPAHSSDLTPLSTFRFLFLLNLLLLINRLWSRGKALRVVYNKPWALVVLARYPLSVLVNGLASFLALKNHASSLFLKQPTSWVKTHHELPEGFGEVLPQSASGAL